MFRTQSAIASGFGASSGDMAIGRPSVAYCHVFPGTLRCSHGSFGVDLMLRVDVEPKLTIKEVIITKDQ